MSKDLDDLIEFRRKIADRYTPAELVDLLDIDIWTLIEKFDDEELCVPELLEEMNYELD